MYEDYPQAFFNPESFAYGDTVISTVASELRQDVNTAMARGALAVAVETKIDQRGGESPVTAYDKATEERIGIFYNGTTVRIKGEEQMTNWPVGKKAGLDLHVDPIDGTKLFIEHLRDLAVWSQLPEDNRPPRPICGAMVSAGALVPGDSNPRWSSIAAPFLAADGIVRWAFGPNQLASRVEPDGSVHELAHANSLQTPEQGGVVLVASSSSERLFGGALHDAGFRVIKYKSAVAAGLCAMDTTLFHRLQPNVLGDDRIVGAVMGSAKNWDVAGLVGIANDRGHFVSDTHGQPRTFEDGKQGAIFASQEAIGRTILQAIAPIAKTM
jgi:3'-phosphoadenosine 5'-phosphosulfate (PAPS) 3'-phosphatase